MTVPGFDGKCSVMWIGDRIKIVDADPRVSLSGELVQRISDGYGNPAVSLVGDVLTFQGENRTVVYRVYRDRYDSAMDCYPAEWPD